MVISDNGASAEGGVTGSFNEMRFFNQVPESFEDNLAHIDDLGGPASYNHYAWGWAWAGDTPFRRWKRETYRGGSTDPFVLAWPAGIAARGEVRTQYAHAIDMVPTVLDALGIQPPEAIRGVPQTPLEGVSFAHTFDDAERARPSTSRSTSRCSATARSTTTAGERCARGRRRTSRPPRSSAASSAQPITPEILDELDRSGWELYRWPTTRASRTTSPPSTRRSCATWSRAGGRRRRSTRSSRSTLAAATARDGAPADLEAADPLRLLPGRLGRPRVRRAAGLQPRLLDRGRRRHPRGRRRGRAALPGRRRRWLRLLHEGRPALLPLQLRRPRPLRGARRQRRPHGGPPRPALRVRADRRAGHRERQGRPGARGALHRRRARRRDRLPAHDPAVLRARRAELRLRLRRAGGRVRRRRSRSPARSARLRSTSRAS